MPVKFNSLTKDELEHCQYLAKNKFLNVEKETEEYKLNYNFKNKKIKIDIHNFTPKVMAEKKKIDDVKFIDDDRKIVIQSVLVRIMKTRKTLEHTKLIQECLGDINRFTPDISMVKKCIEMLIDKDYFERNEDNRKIYNYVA